MKPLVVRLAFLVSGLWETLISEKVYFSDRLSFTRTLNSSSFDSTALEPKVFFMLVNAKYHFLVL